MTKCRAGGGQGTDKLRQDGSVACGIGEGKELQSGGEQEMDNEEKEKEQFQSNPPRHSTLGRNRDNEKNNEEKEK